MAKKAKSSKTPKAVAEDAVEKTDKILDASGADSTEPDTAAKDGDSPDTGANDGVGTDVPAESDEKSAQKQESEPEPLLLTEAAPEPAPEPTPEPVVIKKGGFIPLVLGGAAAAVIGFGAARYVLPEGWPWPGAGNDTFQTDVTAKLEAQEKALANLQTELGKGPDLTPVTEQITGLQAAVDTLAAQIGEAKTQLAGFETRLTDLEKRPITAGASPSAVAAYERELKALQDAMAAQRAEIEQLAKEAEAKKASAEMTAQEAMQRTALSQIQTALDTGNGFAEAAKSLTASGITVPPELAQVAEKGVLSRAQLAEAFPDAARAALAAARKADGGGGGLGGFLKTQLGARSLEPREGTDPDAVLSRAEAAVKEGRLNDAMVELDALPEVARAEMKTWLDSAAARSAALKAADALATELN